MVPIISAPTTISKVSVKTRYGGGISGHVFINICNDASGAQCCEIQLNKFGQKFAVYQVENYSGKYLKECQDYPLTSNILFITMRCQGDGSETGCAPGWVGELANLTLTVSEWLNVFFTLTDIMSYILCNVGLPPYTMYTK